MKNNKYQKKKKEINREDYISHETCNAPAQEILDKYGIIAVGEQHGVQSRERLLIPKKLLKKKGYSLEGDALSIISNCEHLLVKIENEYNKIKNKTTKI